MEYILTLTFANTDDEKSSLIIDGVKNNLTKDQISSLMDTIITNKIFYNSKGSLAKKVSASFTSKTVTEYDLAE